MSIQSEATLEYKRQFYDKTKQFKKGLLQNMFV